MPKGYSDAGRLPSGRKGGRGKKLFERNGVFFTWQRPKGKWRQVSRPLRRLGVGPGGSDWVVKGKQRCRLLEVWRVRKCSECNQVRYTWSQVVYRVATKTVDGWRVRSFPIKKSDVKKPWLVGHESKKPLVVCRCLGKNGVPRPSVVERLAKGIILHKGVGVSRDELLTPSSAALW